MKTAPQVQREGALKRTSRFRRSCVVAAARPMMRKVAPTSASEPFHPLELPTVLMPSVELSADLVSRVEYETEWWYYYGYLEAGTRRFAFHLAFFRRRTDDVWIGSVFPLRWLGKHVRFAHFGLTDFTRRRFRYGHQRSMFNHGGTSADRFHVWIRDWSISAAGTDHRLRAALDDAAIDLQLSPLKAAVFHRPPFGFLDGPNLPARYWSCPRLSVAGQVTVEGQVVDVVGTAWMDRAYGRLALSHEASRAEGWDWFGIQLDDGRELMFHRQRAFGDPADEVPVHATLIDGDGRAEYLKSSDLTARARSYWTSPRTAVRYPISWMIAAPAHGIDLTIEPRLRNHELDTRGSTCLMYWEGPGEVVGTVNDRAVTGRGFVELVGYDRRSVPTGCFDFQSGNLSLLGVLNNERWYRASRDGVLEADGAFPEQETATGNR